MFSLSVGTLISTLIEYKSSFVPVLLSLRPQAMCVFEIQKRKNKILLLWTLNTVGFPPKSNCHSPFFSWGVSSPFPSCWWHKSSTILHSHPQSEDMQRIYEVFPAVDPCQASHCQVTCMLVDRSIITQKDPLFGALSS